MTNKSNNTVQALWVGLGSLSSFALGIVSAAILSRYFDKAEYGTYKQILYVYHTLLVVFAAGLPSVFGYFLPRYSLAQGKDIVLKITKVLFLFGIVFSLTLFFTAPIIAGVLKNPELETGLKYFSPIPMLLLPTLGIEGIFSTYKKTLFIAIYNVITRLLMLAFIVTPVIVFKGSYISAIYGWIIVSVISLIIAIYFRTIPFKGVIAEKSNLNLKTVLNYSLPLVAASIAGVAIKAADQFYISRFFGAEVFAEFSNGFMEIPFVGMITGAASVVLLPYFSKLSFQDSGFQELIKTWRSVLNKSASIIYPMVIFFMFYSAEIVTFLYSEKYDNSKIYFQIAMFLNYFNIIIFAPILFAMGKTRFYSRLHIFIAIAAWGLGYVVTIGFESPIAVAILSVLLSITKIIIAFVFISRMIRVKLIELIPGEIIYYILHSLTIMMLIKYVIMKFLPIDNLLVNISSSAIVFLLLLLLTARPLKLDYLIGIKPLWDQFAKKS